MCKFGYTEFPACLQGLTSVNITFIWAHLVFFRSSLCSVNIFLLLTVSENILRLRSKCWYTFIYVESGENLDSIVLCDTVTAFSHWSFLSLPPSWGRALSVGFSPENTAKCLSGSRCRRGLQVDTVIFQIESMILLH